MKYNTYTGNEMLDTCISILVAYGPSLWYGLKTTLLIAFVGTLFGLAIGLCIGGTRAMQVEKGSFRYVLKKIFDVFAYLYIEVFRGTPMMVQAMFIYYWLRPYLGWTPLIAGIVIISINTGAYMSEIIRAGIQSVDVGQNEAARSLGMSLPQTFIHVILPQAIRNAFPAIGNEFIVNIKDSSVLNVISVTELFFQSRSIAGSIWKYKETFLVTAAIYLVLTMVTGAILKAIENRITGHKSSLPSSVTSSVLVQKGEK